MNDVIGWLAFAALALFAPAPYLGRSAPTVAPGQYTLTCFYGTVPARFSADGTWWNRTGATDWVGTWRCEDGVLYLAEWVPAGDDVFVLRWRVRLETATRGRDEGRREFRLRPQRPRVE